MATKNYALVENGVVENTIIWDGDEENWQPPPGVIAVEMPDEPSGISIGWKYSNSTFSPAA